MPPRRIILLVLMVLSAVGFLIDRVFLGEPAGATAAPAPVASTPSTSPPRTAPRPETPAIETATTDDPSLAWLDKLAASPEAPRNVFAPSEELRVFLDVQEPGGKDKQNEKDENDPARFEAAHKLQATFLSDQQMLAMIDGRVVHVGSVLDGYTIAHIDSRRVECVRDGQRAILQMEVPLR